jgi:two-component system sensor histidine kinase YesM
MHKFVQIIIKNLSMKNLFLIFMLLFTVIPSMFLLLISTAYTKNTITRNYSGQYLDTIHSTLNNNLSDIIYQMNISSTTLSSIENITNTLNSGEKNYDTKNYVIESELSDIVAHDIAISGITIITLDGENYSYFNNGKSLSFEDTNFLSDLSQTAFSVYDRCIVSGENSYIVFGKDYFNYATGKKIGKLLFYIENEKLYSLYSASVIKNAETFLTCNDTVILHPDKTKINSKMLIPPELKKELSNTNEYIFSEFALDLPLHNSEIKSVSILSHSDTLSLVRVIISKLWMVFIPIIIISFFVSYLLSKKFSASLSDLKYSMEQVADNIDTEIRTSPKNEIYALEISFEKMTMQIKNLTRMNNIEKEKQRIAELNTLQAQISPHFIYNALDIAYSLATLKGQNDVEEILYALAEYFRLGLHNASNYTTVENEMKHVESFLVIERIRFPNLFDVSFDIDERIKDYKMIKIVIQPIVENAIKHGFKDISYKGKLSISGSLEESGDVLFVISDNGIGMDKPPTLTLPKKNGFGLFNVNERLVRSYGLDYGLKIDSQNGIGTTVSFKIKPLSEE